jgi:hypothetical protein
MPAARLLIAVLTVEALALAFSPEISLRVGKRPFFVA